MSGWNYRIVRHTRTVGKGDESWKNVSYSIHEAFYTTDGLVGSITTDPICISGDNLAELRDCYALIIEAFSRPVLDYDNIPEPGYDETKDPIALAMKEIPKALEELNFDAWKDGDRDSVLLDPNGPEMKRHLAEEHKERQLQEHIHNNQFVDIKPGKLIEGIFLKDDEDES